MKIFSALMVLLMSGFALADDSGTSNFVQPQAVLQMRCGHCHGDFEKVPQLRFLRSTALFFDFKNGGKNQKVPPRMTGVRLSIEEVAFLRDWVVKGAPDAGGQPTLTPEQIALILK